MTAHRSTLLIALLVSLAGSAALAYPTARTESAMVFDTASQSVLLFGGATGLDANGVRHPLGDTWQWTGRRWIRVYPTSSPDARFGHAMVYDSNHGQAVLFGGAVIPRALDDPATKFFNDTWVFRGGDWSRVETPSSPPARRLMGSTFDPIRDRMIVFGGSANGQPLYDTWEFDGTTWTSVNAAGPKLRTPLLVFDEKRDEVLLLGTSESNTTEMYRYKKPDWEKIDVADIPPCLVQAGATYQRHNETVLVVSGGCATDLLIEDDLYEWNGEKWTKLTLTITQGSMYGFAIAYDRARGETVLFGGFDFDERSLTVRFRDGNFLFGNEQFTPSPRSIVVFESDPDRGVIWQYGGHNERGDFYDLWKYSAGRWESVKAADQPSCSYPLGVYDTDRKRLVLVCNDSSTFEWDGEKWYKFADLKDLPPGRRFASLTYDATLKKTVLFGGYNGSYLKETWTWDGTKWTEVKPKKKPNSRSLAALFYDPISKKTLLFGGIGRPNDEAAIVRYADMWSFDGTNWTEMTGTTKPPARYGGQGDVDPSTGKYVLFGGKSESEDYLNEQWEWNGTTWTKVEHPNAPSPRMNAGLTFDPVSGQATLFGGYAGGYFSEVWVLDTTGWTLVQERSGRRRGTGR